MSDSPAMTDAIRTNSTAIDTQGNTPVGEVSTPSMNNPSACRSHNRSRFNHSQSSTPRDFAGATPKIGGILALRSENMTNKVTYDKFCEKLKVYIMNDFKGGENVVEVTKNPSVDIVSYFEANNKPINLTKEEKESDIDVEIKNKKSRIM